MSSTLGVSRYNITFVCDYTGWTEVFLLPGTKLECCSSAFVTLGESTKARSFEIMRFRCDNGKGVYSNKLFRGMLTSSGITYESCSSYAHHKNGVAETMIQSNGPRLGLGSTHSRLPPPNESLRREQRQYITPCEMLYSYRKPSHTADKTLISCGNTTPPSRLRILGEQANS